jgi:hypothetical protein
MNKPKTGFAAYEEIRALARDVYGPDVEVIASVFGDDYMIKAVKNDAVVNIQGTAADIRGKLTALKFTREHFQIAVIGRDEVKP